MQQWWIQHINFTKQFKTSCIQINLQCSIYLHWSVGQHRVAFNGPTWGCRSRSEPSSPPSSARSGTSGCIQRPSFTEKATISSSFASHPDCLFAESFPFFLLKMTFKSQRWQFTITNLQRAINLRQRSVNLLFSPPCICSKLKYLFTEGSIILQYMFLNMFFFFIFFHLLRAFAESWNAFSSKTPTGWPDAPCICSKRNISAEGGEKQVEKQKERSWKCQLVFAWHWRHLELYGVKWL